VLIGVHRRRKILYGAAFSMLEKEDFGPPMNADQRR
jgi:hypothetical protein